MEGSATARISGSRIMQASLFLYGSVERHPFCLPQAATATAMCSSLTDHHRCLVTPGVAVQHCVETTVTGSSLRACTDVCGQLHTVHWQAAHHAADLEPACHSKTLLVHALPAAPSTSSASCSYSCLSNLQPAAHASSLHQLVPSNCRTKQPGATAEACTCQSQTP